MPLSLPLLLFIFDLFEHHAEVQQTQGVPRTCRKNQTVDLAALTGESEGGRESQEPGAREVVKAKRVGGWREQKQTMEEGGEDGDGYCRRVSPVLLNSWTVDKTGAEVGRAEVEEYEGEGEL
ncbi:unnamed protein product [Rhizoctonia solani]|uniref:Uncharacterized protein n=1 Tax=Rhizoctonia solani TaxID=456999 RepID=A0A8H2Y058_9AGAM|nr:unnamed protein product [Rhizoctonia solani]CAE6455822.1 unnamed protein product [Rhizoctonia solani]